MVVIHYFSTLDSTNTEAVRMAEHGADHGTVIHADCQTGGRGRGGRNFFSPAGGLYFSIIIRPTIELQLLPMITLAAGVGVSTCIMASTQANVLLKWPNDLYLDGKKLGGILTESGPVSRGLGPEYLVVGVGINVKTQPEQFPSSLRSRVVSLYHYSEQHIDVIPLLNRLVVAVLSSVKELESNTDSVIAQWQSLDYLRGKLVEYETPSGVIQATGQGLAPDGRYIVQDQNGDVHRVLAGDLHPIRCGFTE
ncbi:MAG: biotin--[acetyl-CoA-carboxylase] ligase [Desulfobulbus sp.]|nr:MAG: biotin--[acetyl-CoA-carboxylase] ligase [Desulfobulbus sp.]